MPSREELLAEAQRRGLDINKLQNHNFSGDELAGATIFSDPELFHTKMKDFYTNSLLGAGITGANRGFAKIFGFGKHQKDTQKAYEEALESSPWATEIGNAAAQMYSSAPFAMATGVTPGAGMLRNLGGVAASGAATGLAETPYGDESRLGNMSQNAIANMILPALGYAAKPIGKVLKGTGKEVYNVAKHGFKPKEQIAQKIRSKATELKAKYSGPKGLFEGFIKKADKGNVKINLPYDANTAKIINKELDGVNKATRKAVIKAHKTNSVRDVMDAESKLGKFQRKQYQNAKKGAILNQDAIDAAKEMENSLGKHLQKSILKQNPQLGKELKDIRAGYKEELVPYLNNSAIQKFLNNESVGSDLIRALQGKGVAGQQFRAKLASEHPEVRAKQIADLLIKLGVGGTIYGGYRHFSD